MGKSLAQQIAEAKGGDVEAESPPPEPERLPPPAPPTLGGELSPKEARMAEFAWHLVFGRKPFNLQAAYQAVVPDAKPKMASQAGSRWFREPFVQAQLVQVIRQAAERKELNEEFVLEHWLAMSQANVFDYFDVVPDDDGAGQLRLRTEALQAMPKLQQQNIKKISVTTTRNTIERKDSTQTVETQTINLELVDKAAAVKNLATFLGMMKGKEGLDIEDLAEELRRAEERARRRAPVIYDHETQQPMG